jgi:hypothetical protein
MVLVGRPATSAWVMASPTVKGEPPTTLFVSMS